MDMNQDKLNEKAAPAAEKPGEAAPAAPDKGRAEDKAPAAPAADIAIEVGDDEDL